MASLGLLFVFLPLTTSRFFLSFLLFFPHHRSIPRLTSLLTGSWLPSSQSVTLLLHFPVWPLSTQHRASGHKVKTCRQIPRCLETSGHLAPRNHHSWIMEFFTFQSPLDIGWTEPHQPQPKHSPLSACNSLFFSHGELSPSITLLREKKGRNVSLLLFLGPAHHHALPQFFSC